MPGDRPSPHPIPTKTISESGPVLVVCPDVRTRDAARVIFGACDPGEPEAYYPTVAGDGWDKLPPRFTAAIYVPKWDRRLTPEAAERFRAEVRVMLAGSGYTKTELFIT